MTLNDSLVCLKDQLFCFHILTVTKKFAALIFFCLLIFTSKTYASVEIHVADVGSGLCILSIDKKNRKYFLYDAGRWDNQICSKLVSNHTKGRDLSLLVISHSDMDHMGNLYSILNSNRVEMIVYTGYVRKNSLWRKANHEIEKAATNSTKVINLTDVALEEIKNPIAVGDMEIDFLYGKGLWDMNHGFLPENHRRNAVSIVIKIKAFGRTVLIAGDTVGRHSGDDDYVCDYAEKQIVRSKRELPSDVLIAGHHGADNASSSCFVAAVNPKYVIFSAGHRYAHPRENTVKRIQKFVNVKDEQIFRTDRGDDEGHKEWNYGRIDNCIDVPDDDSIVVKISPGAPVDVRYLSDINKCK